MKYKELLEKGLEDRCSKRKYEQEPRTELEQAQIRIAQLEHQLRIRDYIYYYNTQRVQRNLGVVTPMGKHQMIFAA